jgi:hypothetical protein
MATRNHIQRREFLRDLAVGAAAGSGCLAFGDLNGALAQLSGWRVGTTAAGPAPDGPLQMPGRAFEMVVFGDSIMWGQGLDDEQKFTYKVQKWLEQRLPGTTVHRHVFAHSGARIEPDEGQDAKPPTHGEVPNHFPSISAQISLARTWLKEHELLDPAAVALVLMDGGINDFGTKVILTPDPTRGRAWVREQTRHLCVDRMKWLLPHVLTAFPNAKVAVTNYFQIVSDQSDMVYLWELLRKWEIIGPTVNAISEPLRRKFAAQSLAFHEESTKGFREAVAEARPLEVTASPATAAARDKTIRQLEQLQDRRLELSRVALAEIPFGPRNSYGAPDTFLFYLNEPDPAASDRKPACVALNKAWDVNCLLAAAGHPNVKGDQVYADAIIKTLARWVPEWGGKLPTVRTIDRGQVTTPGAVKPKRPLPR